ncbi:hypothetical protein DPEC_G00364070 [Dallia pectoralis]|nr:hypothetical protein DPEC_G00364070 [Dallia pectoralis]
MYQKTLTDEDLLKRVPGSWPPPSAGRLPSRVGGGEAAYASESRYWDSPNQLSRTIELQLSWDHLSHASAQSAQRCQLEAELRAAESDYRRDYRTESGRRLRQPCHTDGAGFDSRTPAGNWLLCHSLSGFIILTATTSILGSTHDTPSCSSLPPHQVVIDCHSAAQLPLLSLASGQVPVSMPIAEAMATPAAAALLPAVAGD